MIPHTAVYAPRREATQSVNKTDNEVDTVIFGIFTMEDIGSGDASSMNLFCNLTYSPQLREYCVSVVIRTAAWRRVTEMPVRRPYETNFGLRKFDNHHGSILANA